jgi:hypothetical protein
MIIEAIFRVRYTHYLKVKQCDPEVSGSPRRVQSNRFVIKIGLLLLTRPSLAFKFSHM